MKIIYILSLMLGILIAGSAYGQVPGYIGKKIHLQGGIKFFPSFVNPVNLSQANSYIYTVPGMNYRLELGMDFMISRKSSIGFNAHYYNTAMYYYNPIYGNDRRLSIDGGAFGAVFKTHFGGWVAPLGFYYRLEAGALVFAINDYANNFGGAFTSTTLGAGYINNAFGRTHIFGNRISLDYGVELGWVLPPYDYSTLQGSSNIRMAIHYSANVYVKIGGVF